MDYLTLEAYRVIKGASVVWVRTAQHPIIDHLIAEGVHFESFDALYETSDDFDTVYRGIADRIQEMLIEGDVIYAVPGNPFVAEKAVALLVSEVPKAQIRVVHGASFLDAIITSTKIDPVAGLQVIDALRLEEMPLDNHGTLVCIQCYNAVVAADLKIWLSRLYRDEHPVTVVRGVGIPELEKLETMPLYALDRYEGFDHLTSVVVPRQVATQRHTFKGLLDIMAALRGPEGCPWDREQDHKSLMPFVLEEAYEVAEAIHKDDVFLLEEELGDVLLQVVFHAQIGRENGDFAIEDVIDSICTKMINRHPHVFGSVLAETSEKVLENWEAIKREENQHHTVAQTMSKFTTSLPALFRAYKVQGKAAKVGFDWPNANMVFDKINEEIEELKEAIEAKDENAVSEELGDLLFSVVNLARKLEVDSEFALHGTTQKFIERFQYVEQEMSDNALNMEDLDIEKLEEAWQRAKKVNIFKNK